MNVFQFQDYRAYLKSFFRSQGKGGRGQLSRLAEALGVHSTFVSLVFKEKRDLSPEQAMKVAQHLNLTAAETDFFLELVHLGRAGTARLRDFHLAKIRAAQEAAKKLSTRYEHERTLDAEERQIFYSSWHYSAIRIFASTAPGGRTVEDICRRFALPRDTVVSAVHFLVETHLLRQEGSHYLVGAQRTFLEKGHALLKCHHSNWRLKALQQYERLSDDELMFTTTLSVSRADFAKLRETLAEFVKTTSRVIQETDPDDVACVNLDLFWVR